MDYDVVIFINENKRVAPVLRLKNKITTPYIVIPGSSYAVFNGLPGILNKSKAIKAIIEQTYKEEPEEEPFDP